MSIEHDPLSDEEFEKWAGAKADRLTQLSAWHEARRRVHHIVRHAIRAQEENKRLRDWVNDAVPTLRDFYNSSIHKQAPHEWCTQDHESLRLFRKRIKAAVAALEGKE